MRTLVFVGVDKKKDSREEQGLKGYIGHKGRKKNNYT